MEDYRNILFTECCRMSWKYYSHRTLWKVLSFKKMRRQSRLNEASQIKHHYYMMRYVLVAWCHSFPPACHNLFFPHYYNKATITTIKSFKWFQPVEFCKTFLYFKYSKMMFLVLSQVYYWGFNSYTHNNYNYIITTKWSYFDQKLFTKE